MSRQCPQCETENKDDNEVVVAVFMDDYGAPNTPNIVHTFCDTNCYLKWKENVNFREIRDLKTEGQIKNIDYDKFYD